MEHSHILDALSGQRLKTLEQCVKINLNGDGAFENVVDVQVLSDKLYALHAQLCSGGEVLTAKSACVLITAPPAAGKTSLMSQLIVSVAKTSSELVPIVVKMQQLQAKLLSDRAAFSTACEGASRLPLASASVIVLPFAIPFS
eukprot:3313500-Prymnesium_polylepis.2